MRPHLEPAADQALSHLVLKTLGYVISTVSVVLLALPAWKSAAEHPLLLLALMMGMATSMAGMFLRWLAHRRERKPKGR
ncbi:MAG TPA: hypothetical protein VJU34_12485 [Phenylobacterium sp.]|nr:hypothetical protein [Phenylobacterium sp.]